MTTAEKIYKDAHAEPTTQEVHEMELFFESHPAIEDIIRTLLAIPVEEREAAIKAMLTEVEQIKAER